MWLFRLPNNRILHVLLLLLLLLLYTKMSRAYKAILLRDKENDFTNRNDHPGDS
jgi:hypothetical protein